MVRPDRKNATINSALWAGYGDSLGFISELTDEHGLSRRLRGARLTSTVAWQRQIGGKFGAFVDLPAGCYSDDTQLRLATCRCIRSDGSFDVEAFAKVELPVWLSYAIGAGTGTKAAAANLSSQGATWFSNFYAKGTATYFRSGGNGAAMRIQPHVLSARSLDDHVQILRDVFRNSICTHGHARAIAGAGFHALALAHVVDNGEIPEPSDWYRFVSQLAIFEDIAYDDAEISTFWLPAWEQAGNQSFSAAIQSVQEELLRDIGVIADSLRRNEPQSYALTVERVNGLDPSLRGAGTTTALLGMALSWAFQDLGPKEALLIGARLVGSDTDTNSTLAGAIVGALADTGPDDSVMDREYLVSEAERLYNVCKGKASSSFIYPDLLGWSPPRNALDCVGLWNGRACLAGLSNLEFSGSFFPTRSTGDSGWQWATLGFGQSVLCKRRIELKELSPRQYPPSHCFKTKVASSELKEHLALQDKSRDMDLFRDRTKQPSAATAPVANSKRTVDELTNEAIKSGFDPMTIGRHLLEIAERNSEIELGIAYTSIILKARKARLNSDRSR